MYEFLYIYFLFLLLCYHFLNILIFTKKIIVIKITFHMFIFNINFIDLNSFRRGLLQENASSIMKTSYSQFHQLRMRTATFIFQSQSAPLDMYNAVLLTRSNIFRAKTEKQFFFRKLNKVIHSRLGMHFSENYRRNSAQMPNVFTPVQKVTFKLGNSSFR